MSLLTSKLSDENRKKAHELFGVPEQFDEVADLMVHEEEWQVYLLMGKEPMTEKELRKLMEKNRLAASPYVLINRMYSATYSTRSRMRTSRPGRSATSTAAIPTMRNLSTMSSAVCRESSSRRSTTGRQRFISRSICRK